jgi:Tfp pilus assembly protein PilZ
MEPQRRRHPRIALSVVVDVHTEHNFYTGKTRDISEGGLFIECEIGLEPGADVTVNLRLGKKTYVLPCKVAWVLTADGGRAAGCGVEFAELGGAARKAIEAFMRRRDPMSFDVDDPDPEEPAEEPVDKPRGGPPPLPGAG